MTEPKEKEKKSGNGETDWRDDWFSKHGVTEDEDKSFLNSRALADEFTEEARKQRTPKKDASGKRLFGGRAGKD